MIEEKVDVDFYNMRVYWWSIRMRHLYNIGVLSGHKIKKMNKIAGWSWNQKEGSWERNLAILRRYAEREGHAIVPKDCKEEGENLGQWVNNQRKLYKKKKLEKSKIEKLEEVKSWSWKPIEEYWDKLYGILRRYAEREGHAIVPFDCKEEGKNLGRWVGWQRTLYKKKKLEKSKIEKLEEVKSWSWNPYEEYWDKLYGILRRYAEREGHAIVPKDCKEEGENLGTWVSNQRALYKEKKLEKSKIEKLEKVKGWSWNLHEEYWDKFYGILRRYAEREGHAIVPARHIEEGKNLGIWVSRQRKLYKKNKIDKDIIEKLEEVKGWKWRIIKK
jgi:hypothetical protein